MSLQIWLPLNGNLQNQGLSNISLTNSGATVNSKGKIGSCYSFSANGYLYENTYDWTNFNTSTFSLCCWYKEPSPVASGNSQIICIGTNSGWNNIRIGLLRRLTSGYPMFSVSDGNTAIQYNFTATAFTLDTWNHIAVTYNNGTITMYINGVLDKSSTTTITPVLNSSQHLGIGAASNGAEKLTGFLNDVRIYDHCLSVAEVHEIYKAKILHLKLSDNYNSITNVFTTPTFNTSAAAGGWLHWGPTGHLGTYGQNTDSKYIYYPNQTYSHWIAEGNPIGTSGKYYICYQSPAFEGGYRSVQFIIKEQNSLPITNSICVPSWNGKVTGTTPMTEWTEIVPLGNGFYLCKCDGFQQTGSDDLVSILVFAGYKIYVTQAVLENDKKMCSDIFRQGDLTNIYDCSGYRHNAITNAITSLPDSARYGSSAVFNGSSSYVKVTDTGWMVNGAEQMTINFWAKTSTWPATTRIISCTEGGGWNIEPGNSGYYRVPMHVYTNTSGSVGYVFDSNEFKISDLPTNEWVMLTITYNKNTGHKTFINGMLHHSYTNVSYGLHYAPTASRLYLGCESNGVNPGTPYWAGQMSDFRIYSTELSDDDIRQLYETSVYIDNNGNVYTGEFKEVAQ